MAERTTITAANSKFLLSIAGLYTTPQLLQGYSTDAAFETEAAEPAEIQMGVDGKMSAGLVPVVTLQTISLQADSASVEIFERWYAQQQLNGEILYADATVIIPATNRTYAHVKGVLSSWTQTPSAKKVLQPRVARITWESIFPSPGA